MELGAVYVSVTSLDRAETFYTELFEREPELRTDASLGYQLDSVLFLVMDEAGMDEEIEYGNNCVPNFLVSDVDAEFERVRSLSPPNMDDAIQRNGPYELFSFTDPEGNVLECYAEGR